MIMSQIGTNASLALIAPRCRITYEHDAAIPKGNSDLKLLAPFGLTIEKKAQGLLDCVDFLFQLLKFRHVFESRSQNLEF